MVGLNVNIDKVLQKRHPLRRGKIAIMLHDIPQHITYFLAIVKLWAMAMCGVENV